MHNLIIYFIGTAIIVALMSYLYTKKGAPATTRVIRLFSGATSIMFLIISLGIAYRLAISRGRLVRDEILICIIFLPFTLVLGILVAVIAISKKHADRIAKEFTFSETKKEGVPKRGIIDIVLWVFGIGVLACGAIALKTYSLFFFICFLLSVLIMLAIRFKRGY